MKSTTLLDDTGWKLLDELQRDARLSLSELGRRVGLSTPAVKERVAQMEEQGIIAGYQAVVDPRKAGYAVLAFVRMTVTGDERVARRLVAEVCEMPEVMECHRSTGDHAFILKAVAGSVETLEKLIDRLTAYGMTSTSVGLSSPLSRSVLMRPMEGGLGAGKDRRKRG
jgi:Lrp/AsnC family transcriptional regulator, leucine-responsive regulatory protein